MDLGNFNLNPLTLALLIMGLVEFVKKFKVAGNKLIIISMIIGIVLAVIYKVSSLVPAAQVYIEIAFFGLAAGLCASGIYNFVNARFPVQTKTSLKFTKVTTRTHPLGGEPTERRTFQDGEIYLSTPPLPRQHRRRRHQRCQHRFHLRGGRTSPSV
jgi:membrane-bound ClpP family serine protease